MQAESAPVAMAAGKSAEAFGALVAEQADRVVGRLPQVRPGTDLMNSSLMRLTMKPSFATASSTRTPSWPTKRVIAAATAEIRSHWSETERRHRAEVVQKRLQELASVIETSD